jgi:hypothetical protein
MMPLRRTLRDIRAVTIISISTSTSTTTTHNDGSGSGNLPVVVVVVYARAQTGRWSLQWRHARGICGTIFLEMRIGSSRSDNHNNRINGRCIPAMF